MPMYSALFKVANLVYTIFCCGGRFSAAHRTHATLPDYTNIQHLPGSDPVTAERRRQKALNTLEARLAKMGVPDAGTPSKPGSSSAPSQEVPGPAGGESNA
eukprot:GFYU01005001.1.p2 GENE.GFYU01005001.1~~GFYU01005001.1.p2  ORF type:complete len:101 (-),score=18.43 GFYU01005001.1:137-439(-)